MSMPYLFATNAQAWLQKAPSSSSSSIVVVVSTDSSSSSRSSSSSSSVIIPEIEVPYKMALQSNDTPNYIGPRY